MPGISTILAFLGFAGAIASWIVGAVLVARTLAAIPGNGVMVFLSPFAWPLALQKVRKVRADAGANVNKALVAFIACMLVGMAAFAAAANLSRFAK